MTHPIQRIINHLPELATLEQDIHSILEVAYNRIEAGDRKTSKAMIESAMRSTEKLINQLNDDELIIRNLPHLLMSSPESIAWLLSEIPVKVWTDALKEHNGEVMEKLRELCEEL